MELRPQRMTNDSTPPGNQDPSTYQSTPGMQQKQTDHNFFDNAHVLSPNKRPFNRSNHLNDSMEMAYFGGNSTFKRPSRERSPRPPGTFRDYFLGDTVMPSSRVVG